MAGLRECPICHAVYTDEAKVCVSPSCAGAWLINYLSIESYPDNLNPYGSTVVDLGQDNTNSERAVEELQKAAEQGFKEMG